MLIALLLTLQTGLIVAVGAVALLFGEWTPASALFWAPAAAVFLAGYVSLGKSLTMSPVPNGRGLRTGGIYRYVRHPMYLSLLLFAGGAVCMTPWAALPLAALAAVLLVKIEMEERYLAQCYEGYEAYKGRTKRLIPFVW